MKNRLTYYPLEKFLSKYADSIITINKEDYNTVNEKDFKSNIHLVNGIWIDVRKFQNLKRKNF